MNHTEPHPQLKLSHYECFASSSQQITGPSHSAAGRHYYWWKCHPILASGLIRKTRLISMISEMKNHFYLEYKCVNSWGRRWENCFISGTTAGWMCCFLVSAMLISVQHLIFSQHRNIPRWSNAGRWPLGNLCLRVQPPTKKKNDITLSAPHTPSQLSPAVVVIAAEWRDRPVPPVLCPRKEQRVRG